MYSIENKHTTKTKQIEFNTRVFYWIKAYNASNNSYYRNKITYTLQIKKNITQIQWLPWLSLSLSLPHKYLYEDLEGKTRWNQKTNNIVGSYPASSEVWIRGVWDSLDKFTVNKTEVRNILIHMQDCIRFLWRRLTLRPQNSQTQKDKPLEFQSSHDYDKFLSICKGRFIIQILIIM